MLDYLPNTDRLQQVEDYVRGCTRDYLIGLNL